MSIIHPLDPRFGCRRQEVQTEGRYRWSGEWINRYNEPHVSVHSTEGFGDRKTRLTPTPKGGPFGHLDPLVSPPQERRPRHHPLSGSRTPIKVSRPFPVGRSPSASEHPPIVPIKITPLFSCLKHGSLSPRGTVYDGVILGRQTDSFN